MLKAYINNSCVPITDRQKYYIEYQYGGQQILSFSLPINDDLNNDLLEEIQIEEDDENRFLIKKISRVGNYIDYTCNLDMDELKSNVYKSTKDLEKFQTKSLLQIITTVLPSGWSVLNADIRDIKRTVELNGATDYDILFKCEEIFDVVFEINNLDKTVRVIDPEQFEYTGLYIHRDLNLKSYTMKGDSSTIITRLYCEGKDGLNFSSINNGKGYVENLSYKNKVLSAYWKDERYTVAENLLTDGKKKLDSLAVPSRSYVFDVVDLANLNDKYDFLAIHLYNLVKVIVDENLSIMNRVVKYRKYLDDNEKSQNVVTLSNEPQTLNNVINNALGGDLKDPVKGNFLEQAKKDSAELINLFATKGHKFETENELYFLDKLPKEAAKCALRINLGGIAFSQNGWAGPYITAWTIDGRFNADFISTGTLKAIRIEAAEIFGGSININNKFIVDINGKLKCIDADISGRITSASGNIAGFELGTEGFTKTTTTTLKKVYASSDENRIENIVLGNIVPTADDYYYLDTNGDGKITAADWIRIEQYFVPAGGTKIYTDVIIDSNPYSPQIMDKPAITIRHRGTNGNTLFQTLIGARQTYTPFLECSTVSAQSGTFEEIWVGGENNSINNFSNTTSYICINNSSWEGGSIWAEYYGGYPNFYIETSNGGYLALSCVNDKIYLKPKTGDYSAFFGPMTNGKCTLGDSNHRFYRLYSRYSEDSTSDRRQKKDFKGFDVRYINLVEELIPTLYRFKEQTDKHSLQAGFIAQDVMEAMEQCGIDRREFGAVKHSVWNDEETKEEKDEYSLVYSMFIPLLTYYIQYQKDDFEKRISNIENVLKEKGVFE